MNLNEKWLAAVERKNSILCAGLDPAEFKMGGGNEGLPETVESRLDKLFWVKRYLDAVAPFCAAVKPNLQYWKGEEDKDLLSGIVTYAQHLGLVTIDDSKLADIGSTNDAGLYHAKQKGFDAVTLAPFAGNVKEAAEQAKKRDIGLISMCLMSNPEYANVKNSLVPVMHWGDYLPEDVVEINGTHYVKQYVHLASAVDNGIDGLVIGAPSKKNHITDEEIKRVREYSCNDTLILLPGVGAQGGEAGAIWKYFDKDNVIVNVGRGLMFPNGSNSTREEQAQAAKQYCDMLNKLRQK